VAKLLAPLDRAPGNVVVKLANDEIEVAQPLLEFSNVLSDDDLIEIIMPTSPKSTAWPLPAARSRARAGGRSDRRARRRAASVTRLVRNCRCRDSAPAGAASGSPSARRRTPPSPPTFRGRRGPRLEELSAPRSKQVGQTGCARHDGRALDPRVDPVTVGKVQAVVYNRMRNRAGFSSQEWKVAYNQVKALADRKQLDERALARFARFGYGHHSAAALTLLLHVGPEVFVKWLAMQDYVAITVALRALGLQPGPVRGDDRLDAVAGPAEPKPTCRTSAGASRR
jgi:hypothetical protein